MLGYEGFSKPHYLLPATFTDKGLKRIEVFRHLEVPCTELEPLSESWTLVSQRHYLETAVAEQSRP